MRIETIEVRNFRCLQNVTVQFDDVTTFVGPNGSGKSTILRALDWFFNADRAVLTEDDLYCGRHATASRVEVKVTFCDLTPTDREALGSKYAPPQADRFTAWRTWESGVDKFTGRGVAFAPFEKVRAAEGAGNKKDLLRAACEEFPDLNLPRWSNVAATALAMDEWEREHPELLTEALISDTHFFGFQGSKKFSGV